MPTRRLCGALLVVTVYGAIVACGENTGDLNDTPPDGPGRFAVVVDGIEGVNHPQLAQQKAKAFIIQTGLSGFWAHSTPTKSFVYYGRYRSAEAPAAKKDLERLKEMAAEGRFRPRFTTLVAVDSAPLSPDSNPLNLRNAHPDSIYTLLVGVYDNEFKGDRRAAAERDAQRLRDDGYEGFFLHEADKSLVSVGTYYHGAYRKIDHPDGRYEMQLHPYLVELSNKPRLRYLKRNGAEWDYTNAQGQTERVRSSLIRIPGK